jgi:hypothetical protein
VLKAGTLDQQLDLLNTVLKSSYALLKSANKNAQSAGSMVLAKIIVNTSDELLQLVIEEVMDKIATTLKNNQFKANAWLIESFIQIIYHLEGGIAQFTARFVTILIEQVQSPDQTCQKVSIDAFCALAATSKDKIIASRVDILQALKPIKTHKVKPVREASLQMIKMLREMDPPLVEHELAQLDELPSARRPQQLG